MDCQWGFGKRALVGLIWQSVISEQVLRREKEADGTCLVQLME
jgi:hypothetical protein